MELTLFWVKTKAINILPWRHLQKQVDAVAESQAQHLQSFNQSLQMAKPDNNVVNLKQSAGCHCARQAGAAGCAGR